MNTSPRLLLAAVVLFHSAFVIPCQAQGLPTASVVYDDWPVALGTASVTQHPSNGWWYGLSPAGGTWGGGAAFRFTLEGAIESLAHFDSQPNGEVNHYGSITGVAPIGGLVLAPDGNFYGVTERGGRGQLKNGTVFRMTPEGRVTTLVEFTQEGEAEGGHPRGGLVVGPDGQLYGSTHSYGNPVVAGQSSVGTLFKMSLSGQLTTLARFSTNGGRGPLGRVAILPDGSIYGVTGGGGSANHGTVYKVSPAGVLTTLVNFTGNGPGSKGAFPYGGLTLDSDGNLYGTTYNGGNSDKGTVFKMTPAGIVTTLVEFTGNSAANEGAYPVGELVLGADGWLYGVTESGGTNSRGTVFKVNPSGGLSTLANLDRPTIAGVSDGTFVVCGGGSMFRMTSNGTLTLISNLHNGSIKGRNPWGSPAFGPDGDLYGTTYQGGSSDDGTVFRLTAAGVRTTVHSFTHGQGILPVGDLLHRPDGYFYGVVRSGAAPDFVDSVFRVTSAGSYSIVAAVGQGYNNSVITGADGAMYGVTGYGGGTAGRSVYRVSSTGVLTRLAEFTDFRPEDTVTLGPDGNYYGVGQIGYWQAGVWVHDDGQVFRLTPTGQFSTLVAFTGNEGQARGRYPQHRLLLAADGNFYGTTSEGGSLNKGTIFKVTLGGLLTTLVEFSGIGGSRKGASACSLVQAPDGFLYGMTSQGGSSNNGTVFRMSVSGGFETLVEFTAEGTGVASGAWPQGHLTLGPDGHLYGMTEHGGRGGGGIVFRLAQDGVQPKLQVEDLDGNVMSSGGMALQFGNVPLGSTATRNYYVTNTGGSVLKLTNFNLPTGYQLADSATEYSVAANATLAIPVQFAPAGAAAAYPGSLTFDCNDPANTVPFEIALVGSAVPSPPELSIFNPANNATVRGTTTTVQVGVKDENLAALSYSLNGGPSVPIAFSGPRVVSDISFTVALTRAGSNQLELTAADAFGDITTLRSNIFLSVPSGAGPLSTTIGPAGAGKITFLPRLLQGSIAELGRTYTVTATPAVGYYLASWTGAASGSSLTTTFTYQEGDTVQANFLPTPYQADKVGLFNGVIDGATQADSGFFSIKVTALSAAFTATAVIDGIKYRFKGTIPAPAGNIVVNDSTNTFSAAMQLNLFGAIPNIQGTLTRLSDSTSLNINAYQCFTRDAPPPGAAAGVYNLALSSPSGTGSYPTGDSVGTLTIKSDGAALTALKLSDGSTVTAACAMCKDGTVPIYGVVKGLLTPTTTGIIGSLYSTALINLEGESSDITAGVSRIFRRANATQYYPAGYGDGLLTALQGAKQSTSTYAGLGLFASGGNVTVTNDLFPINPVTVTLSFTSATSAAGVTTATGVSSLPEKTTTLKITTNGTKQGVVTGSHMDGTTKFILNGIILGKNGTSTFHGHTLSPKPKLIDGTGKGGTLSLGPLE